MTASCGSRIGAYNRIEKWDTAGTLLATYERRAPWFVPIDLALWEAGKSQVGRSTIMMMAEDTRGRLWTVAHRISREREAPLGQWYDGNVDTVIEVLDPRRATVIATGIIRGWMGMSTFSGLTMSYYKSGPNGEPLIDVWEFVLSE